MRREDGELVELRDGSRVLVRPVVPEDKPLFLAGFERLGESSRYRRFFMSKKELSEKELTFFTELDHHGHEAIGALDPETGEGLGVARYLRYSERDDVAEAAVVIIDDWQGRGLGSVLLNRLASRAHDEGIRCFKASLFVSNRAMLVLFERLGEVKVTNRAGEVEEIDVELPLDGDQCAELGEALRTAAKEPDEVELKATAEG